MIKIKKKQTKKIKNHHTTMTIANMKKEKISRIKNTHNNKNNNDETSIEKESPKQSVT